MEEDIRLIESYLRGDHRAFDQLYRNYECRILQLIYCYTTDFYEAEEIMQDVFFIVSQKLNTLLNHEYFCTWLHRIAINKAREHLRKNRRTIRLNNEIDSLELERDDRELKDIISDLEGNESFQIALLYHRDGYTYEQLGEIFEISHETARNRVKRVEIEIRRFLED